jgi:hypothetical protein
MKKRLIIGASIGNCIHVAGVVHFLGVAGDVGYDTLFAGFAVQIDQLMELIRRHRPHMVALSYRLTPQNVLPIIEELKLKSQALAKQPLWVFGGTTPVSDLVKSLGFFDKVFDGSADYDDSISFLRQAENDALEETYETKLIPRLERKRPYPLLRHHFGLPSYEQTLAGVAQIATSRVLDVISLGIDQNTQQFYFDPARRDPRMDGAGGVPVKDDGQFKALKAASLCGNYPLMRCYSGTSDVLPFAGVLADSIDNAWCAVPLFWYNELDGRGTRKLADSMEEAHQLIRWHAGRDIPVELNEPHHWGLRDAHDVISVAASYLSAYHAKKLGVRHYIAQYMFNIPGALRFSMDLAKVLAQIEMTESLHGVGFTSYRQTRAGLPFLAGDLAIAKGQLAATTMLQMAVQPDIIHVVGYSEAEHAATPAVIIESTKIVRGVIRSCLQGNADAAADPAVQARKHELIGQAKYLLDFIRSFYGEYEDPLFEPAALADCVRRGILDAPHIVKNETYRGILHTRLINGRCVAYDAAAKRELDEKQRLEALEAAGLLDKAPGKERAYA